MDTSAYQTVLEAIRPLRLPVEAGHESDVGDAVAHLLADIGGSEPLDQAAYIADLWIDGEEHPHLRELVELAIRVGMPTTGGAGLAPSYFRLVESLSATLQDRDQAIALLSEAPLVFRLAELQNMSATQISVVLQGVLGGTFFPYSAVKSLCRSLGCEKSLDLDQVKELHQRDEAQAALRFADASLQDASEIIGEAGRRLGFEGEVRAALNGICLPSLPDRTHIPYVQTLDFLCTVVEFVDHPPKYLYEFSPRGAVANSIFERYPDHLAAAANPVLNNFKAVEAADWAWARNRVSPASFGLVNLLEGLTKMPHGARRDLAGWIRQWTIHLMSILGQESRRVFDIEAVDAAQCRSLVDWVISENTQTGGSAEQRLVDGLSTLMFRESEGWRGRGFGDAVNISNLSRRKVGDCEFQRAKDRTVIGFEPHGGRLTESYLAGHAKSLRRVVEHRIEGWQAIADLDEWFIDVRFVTHKIDSPISTFDFTHEGVRVRISSLTFDDFATATLGCGTPDELVSALGRYCFRAFNRPQTSQKVRDRISGCTGIPLVDVSLDYLDES